MKWTNPISKDIDWHREIINRTEKEAVAKKAAKRLKDGDVVGVGSGSTSYLALLALVERRDKEKLSFTAIVASVEMELICAALCVPVAQLHLLRPDWSFDGADEVDAKNNIIKGRGGAMLREKLVLKASPERYILIDHSKKVKRLGQNFAVPVEVYPEAVHLVESALNEIKEVTSVSLRQAVVKDGPLITEYGNLVLDVKFSKIALGMEQKLKAIVGVVETGLFMDYKVTIIV